MKKPKLANEKPQMISEKTVRTWTPRSSTASLPRMGHGAHEAASAALNGEIRAAGASFSELSELLRSRGDAMDAVHLCLVGSALVKLLQAHHQQRQAALRPTTPGHRASLVGTIPRHEKVGWLPSSEGAITPKEVQAALHELALLARDRSAQMRPRQSSTIIWILGKMTAAASSDLIMTSPDGAWGGHRDTEADAIMHFISEGIPASWVDECRANVQDGSALTPLHALVADFTAVLVQRLASTQRSASGRDVAQALYGAALQPLYRDKVVSPWRRSVQGNGRDGAGADRDGPVDREDGAADRRRLGDRKRPLDVTDQSPLVASLLSRLQAELPSCQPQDLSMAAYALALLQRGRGAYIGNAGSPSPLQLPPGFADAFLASSSAKLRSCNCQALSNIVWGLACILLPDKRDNDNNGSGSRGRYCSATATDSTLVFPAPVSWIEAFALSSLACMGMFSNKELSLVAWALGKLRWHPGQRWMDKLEVCSIREGCTGGVVQSHMRNSRYHMAILLQFKYLGTQLRFCCTGVKPLLP